MSIDKKFLNLFTKVTEKAAIGASKFIGKNDKIAADQAAVDNMRREFNKIDMDGKIVIGEGEMDEAPMLFIGEKVGTKKGQKIDVPLRYDLTNFLPYFLVFLKKKKLKKFIQWNNHCRKKYNFSSSNCRLYASVN